MFTIIEKIPLNGWFWDKLSDNVFAKSIVPKNAGEILFSKQCNYTYSDAL